jgi:F0F1-type ATP synthase delta subunit
MPDALKLLIPIIAAHIVVLVVILVFIKRLLLGDTLRAVERVKQVETEVRKKEERIRKEIEEHEKDFQKRKADAEEDLRRRREDTDREIARLKDTTIADAKKEGDRILEQARKGEEKMRQQIAQEMEEKAIDYAGEIFKLVFSENVTVALDKQFVGELLEALEQVDAASITVDSGQAEFTTCHPMDLDQKARLEALLKEKFGVDIKIKEKVQESLLAGIVLKLGSLEIDGSLLNRFLEAVAEVKKSSRT